METSNPIVFIDTANHWVKKKSEQSDKYKSFIWVPSSSNSKIGNRHFRLMNKEEEEEKDLDVYETSLRVFLQ